MAAVVRNTYTLCLYDRLWGLQIYQFCRRIDAQESCVVLLALSMCCFPIHHLEVSHQVADEIADTPMRDPTLHAPGLTYNKDNTLVFIVVNCMGDIGELDYRITRPKSLRA